MYLEHMLFSSAMTRFSLAGALPSAIVFIFKDHPGFQSGEKFLKVAISVCLFNVIFPYPTWTLVFITLACYVFACNDVITNLRKGSNIMQRICQCCVLISGV